MVVEDSQSAHSQAGPSQVKINIDCIVPYPDHPEHVVGINVNVVVVDLFRHISRSNRTGVQVQSDKGKRTMVPLTVGTNELALTEA